MADFVVEVVENQVVVAPAGSEFTVALLNERVKIDPVLIIGDGAAPAVTTAVEGVVLGEGAGEALTEADGTVAVGPFALQANATAEWCTATGRAALVNLAAGDGYHTAYGAAAGASVTGGSHSTFLGANAGFSVDQKVDPLHSIAIGAGAYTTADYQLAFSDDVREERRYGHVWARAIPGNNTFFYGKDAGNLTTTSTGSIGFGTGALKDLTTGGNNTAFGFRAMYVMEDGGSNVAFGGNAMLAAVDLLDSVAVGYDALKTCVSGVGAVAVGLKALEFATDAGGNTGVGDSALRYTTTGANNVAMGYTAADQNTTGSNNVLIGAAAGFGYTTANHNVHLGYRSGASRTAGNSNLAAGSLALEEGSGHYNVALGYGSLRFAGTCQGVTAVGYGSGEKATSGLNAVFLGQGAGQGGTQKVDVNNSIAIGSGVNTTKDNQAIFGNSSITETLLRGKVIINAESTNTLGRVDIANAKNNGSIANPADGNLVLTDTTSTAAGTGGSIVFRGAYTGTTVTEAAAIQALKSNSTSGQFGFDLAFHTRVNGGNNTEKVRITTAGNVGIGEAAPDYKLDVNGSFGFTPGDSVTPVDNGDVVFELTNNTTLTIKAKGSDGTVRTATVTLA